MSGHNIVIASLPAGIHGSVPAATTATGLLTSLPHRRIGLLVGIASGIARPHQGQDVRLGDVVVGQPCSTKGKRCPTAAEKWLARSICLPRFFFTPCHPNGSRVPELLQAMWTAYPNMAKPKKVVPGYTHQGFEHDRLFLSAYSHGNGDGCRDCDSRHEVARDKRDTPDPEIHYGIIASGIPNWLTQDLEIRSWTWSAVIV
jgi:hypothetical protein